MLTVEGGRTLETSVGTVFAGRYKVQSTLGSGGMAVVYKAEDAILGRVVALKTLHDQYAQTASFRRRFRQEARAMASLDHENIVKVYDISQDGEVPFIVVEYVAGRDLGSLLGAGPKGRLNEGFVRGMAEQLLLALSYAHRRGIIHRDIKPSNILLKPDGTVKVADFGIARILEEEDEAGGEIVGSARYMSPEQLRGGETTPESDIYSVGVLLYHCLTGRPPFSGDVRSLARQHARETPTPPRRLNRKISPEMEAVVMRALAKDPRERYPSAAAMLADVETEVGPVVRTTETRKRKPRRRRGGLVLAGVLTLLLVLGGGAAFASGLVPNYVGLPTDLVGDVASRMDPVETDPPETPAEPTAEATGDGGEQNTQEDEATTQPTTAGAAGSGAEQAAALVPVPDVTAFYDYFARQRLNASGFDVVFVRDYQEGFAARGVTWGTEPAVGTLAREGSTVTVYATPRDYPPRQIN